MTFQLLRLYHNALQCHFEAQGDRRNKLGLIWDPSDAFTCVVAMQMYAFFNSTQLKHTNIMFRKNPRSMKARYSLRLTDMIYIYIYKTISDNK